MEPDSFYGPILRSDSDFGNGYEIWECYLQMLQVTIDIYNQQRQNQSINHF